MGDHSLLTWVTILLHISTIYSQDTSEDNVYDYIIVGAGSSGATLANRLSEIEDITVLLLEAGDKPTPESDIPLLAISLQQSPADWNFTTAVEEFACQGYENKRCSYPRGKVLGGSSVLNYMVYARGNRKDFDDWAQNGATGWSYDEILPYFQKSEGNRITEPIDEDFHGRDGPLTVSQPIYRTNLLEAYLEAAEALGYPIRDYNGESQIGFSPIQSTTRSGFRCSTEKAFLQPAYRRENLNILTGAHVTKVHLIGEKASEKADGVYYKMNGITYAAKARREVILSSGAINTPQILMLSGIGPKDHLEHHGIDVVVDLPVGENLQDHISTTGIHYTINSTDSIVVSRVMKENVIPGSGPLTSPSTVEAVGFMKSKWEKNPGDVPDIELVILSSMVVFPHLNDQVTKYFEPYLNRDAFSIMPIVLHPMSVGTITLNSDDPEEAPIINLNLLSHKRDRKLLVEGMKMAIAIAESEPLRRFGAQPIKAVLPGCESFKPNTERYLGCVASILSTTTYHPIGTCKMGNPHHLDTVVDPFLRVKGIRGLRVVDASVMPSMMSGHAHAAAVMVAEKAADMIKETYYENEPTMF